MRTSETYIISKTSTKRESFTTLSNLFKTSILVLAEDEPFSKVPNTGTIETECTNHVNLEPEQKKSLAMTLYSQAKVMALMCSLKARCMAKAKVGRFFAESHVQVLHLVNL